MKASIHLAATALLMSALGWDANAQQSQAQHTMPGHQGIMPGQTMGSAQGTMSGAAVPDSPAARAYLEAMEKMHRDMAVELTGDADRDFAQGMIPHHQGAIDMAKVVLEYGNDPEVRELAQHVIQEQEKKINQLQEWLEKHPRMQ